MLEIIDPVTVLDASPHDQIHITHDESADSPRMHNEPESSSREGQQINVDATAHGVIPRDVDMPSGEFEVGANDENPDFQPVPEQLFVENPSVEPQLQSSQASGPTSTKTNQHSTVREERARETLNFECSSPFHPPPRGLTQSEYPPTPEQVWVTVGSTSWRRDRGGASAVLGLRC